MSGSILRECAVCAKPFRVYACKLKLGSRVGMCCSKPCSAVFRTGQPSPKTQKSDAENEARLWAQVERCGPDDCWLWTGAVNAYGYGALSINGRIVGAHRYAYTIANGSVAKGLSVLHRCDVRRCCNPRHHFLGTRGDNCRDMKAKDRAAKGERHSQARLTEHDVHEIRRLHASGASTASLKRRYGSAVYHVVKGSTWAWLKSEAPETGVPSAS